MPGVRVHSAISKKRTGFSFGELHEWIDEGAKEKGVDHRQERHYFNRKDLKAIKDHWDKTKGKAWGKKAVIEWLFHIALDNLQTAYKMSLKEDSYGQNTFNYIGITLNPNGYIACDFRRLPTKEHDSQGRTPKPRNRLPSE